MKGKRKVRNKWERKKMHTEGTFALLKEWQKVWKGHIYNFEYHFWRHQFLDPGGMALARRLHEDVRSTAFMGIQGYIEDGSQRSAWPNGFCVYIYAATLMDRNCDFEAVREDYFRHAYGEDWQQTLALLEEITNTFDFAYMEGTKSKDPRISDFYDPERVPQLDQIKELAARERALAKSHLVMPYRPQTVSWRLLLRHAEFCELFAGILRENALGNNYRALELAKEFCEAFGKYELELERYYDHGLACRVTEHITRKPQGFILD